MLTRLNPFRRPPDAALTPAQTEANIRRLVWEIGWFGVAWGAIINYLQVYEVRLGASSLLVGAITYGPALVSIFWQLPAAGLITRKGHRMRWVIGAGFFYRLMFLLLALIPFFMLQGRAQATAGVWVLQAIPATVSNIAFLSMMADAIPASRMIQVVGWRMAAFGLANTATTLLGGVLLERVRFPLNFQLLFLIGFAASMVSWWHVRHIHVPDREPDRSPRQPLTRQVGRTLRFPRFGRFLLAVGALQLALGMIAPLLPLYWVNQLDATNGQISIIMTVFSGAMVIGSLTMRRLVGKIGRERALHHRHLRLRPLSAADFRLAVGLVAAALGPAGRRAQCRDRCHVVRESGIGHPRSRAHQFHRGLQRGGQYRAVCRADHRRHPRSQRHADRLGAAGGRGGRAGGRGVDGDARCGGTQGDRVTDGDSRARRVRIEVLA